MDELIPYKERQIGGRQILTVDGRDIHAFLGVQKDYSDWVRAQIKRLHLIENEDYVVFPLKGENPRGGRPSNEYAFIFDAAKHICMASSTEKGHEVRKYFLECEARWQDAQRHNRLEDTDFPDLMAMHALVRAVADNRRQLAALSQQTDEANANARLAMRGQQWLTIRQYVTIHKLQRQLPPPLQREYGRYLAGLCREKGIPVYYQKSQEYAEEGTYWITIIEETLPGWLNRRNGQSHLGLA